MTQMRRILLLMVFLLMVFFLQGGEKKIQFELYGGYSLLDPADLNAQAEYDETYLRFYTEDRYSYYHSQAGDFYTYSGGAEGEFKKIKN
ncbi:MAG: hypothetical protein GY771_05255, partial [bacterium]|nr:hypothetical protein [bacterium]